MSYADKMRQYLDQYDYTIVKTPTIASFAEWLDHQAAQEAMGDKPAPQVASCPTPSSEGDEYVCRHPLCGRRWGKDEDKPPCPRV